jgi:hypothetical protein
VAALQKVVGLAAETEAIDQLLVFVFGVRLDVIKVFPADGNELEEAAAGREILFVDVQVVREFKNPLGEKRDLIGGAAGVSFVELIICECDFFCHGRRGWSQPEPDRPS